MIEAITYQDLLLIFRDILHNLGFQENKIVAERWAELINSYDDYQLLNVRKQLKKDFSFFEEKLRFVVKNKAYLKNEEIYKLLIF